VRGSPARSSLPRARAAVSLCFERAAAPKYMLLSIALHAAAAAAATARSFTPSVLYNFSPYTHKLKRPFDILNSGRRGVHQPHVALEPERALRVLGLLARPRRRSRLQGKQRAQLGVFLLGVADAAHQRLERARHEPAAQ
jgi:hypothetical protein